MGKKNEIVVMFKWDEQFVEIEPVIREILMKSKWNMDKPGGVSCMERGITPQIIKNKMNVNVLE